MSRGADAAGRHEYELKARLEGDGEGLADELERLGWSPGFSGEMIDRRYDTADRRLEARDEVLRVRRYRSPDGGERAVLAWKGPVAEEEGFKRRAEIETEVSDPEAAVELLGALGFTAVTAAIDRRVELYRKEGVQLRLESYPVMDTLVEIEGPPAEVDARLEELEAIGLPAGGWEPWPLPRFVQRFEERTGRRARLSREGSGG